MFGIVYNIMEALHHCNRHGRSSASKEQMLYFGSVSEAVAHDWLASLLYRGLWSVRLSKLFHLDLVYQKDHEERTRVPLSPLRASSQLILSLKGNINSWSSVLGYKFCVGRGGVGLHIQMDK